MGNSTLTLKDAKKFLGDYTSIDLALVEAIDADAAELIASYAYMLSFPRVKEISITALSALATHTSNLALGGLTELSSEQARALEKHSAGLSLDGLRAITVKVGINLAKAKGDLSLNGLTLLPDEIAEVLAHHEGSLELNGLVELSDQAALHLSKHKGDLSLNGLVRLSNEAKEILGSLNGDLSLEGLEIKQDVEGDGNLIELYGRAEIFEFCEIESKLFKKLSMLNGKLSHDEELDIWDELEGDLYVHGIFDYEIFVDGERVDNKDIPYIKQLGSVNPFKKEKCYWIRISDAKMQIAVATIPHFDVKNLVMHDQRITLPNGQLFDGHFMSYPEIDFDIDRDGAQIKSERNYLYDGNGVEIEFTNSDSE
jgi:hypothetical protein